MYTVCTAYLPIQFLRYLRQSDKKLFSINVNQLSIGYKLRYKKFLKNCFLDKKLVIWTFPNDTTYP